MNPLRRVLRVMLPAALCVLVVPGTAWAHTELVDTDPADGTSITTPYTARATFSEPLEAERSRVEVRDAAGSVVAEGGVDPDAAETLVVELPGLEPGRYRARWVAIGTDGHVVRETTGFSVVQAPPGTPSPAVTPATTTATTAEPTSTPPAAPTPSPPPPVASTPPPGDDGQPTASVGDLVIALLVAALIIGAVFFVLWRRRPA